LRPGEEFEQKVAKTAKERQTREENVAAFECRGVIEMQSRITSDGHAPALKSRNGSCEGRPKT